ncbi:MAG: ATP-binding protein, partial [Mastigocoleus sp.]
QATHYQIGQLLKSNISNEALESRIFELLSQLNPGLNRIIHPDEKQELAHLNLIAARKAKISAAYEPALKYCNIGINLLSINTWKTDYKLALTLHELAAESAYLCGNNELFEKYVEAIINHAKNALDRISIDEIRIQAYTVQNRFIEALEIAKQSLQEWGIFFPKDISLNVIQQELKETQKCLATFTLNELETLPKMTEVTALASMRLLSSIIATSYIAEPSLFPLIILRMVQCSLQYGNTSSSPYAYACYGILLVNLAKDTESLNKLGELALTLLEKSSDRVIEARTKLVVAGHLYHWKFHFQKSLPLAQESYQIAFHVGDLEYVGYSAQIISFGRYFIGQLLPELEKDVKAYCHTLAKLNQVTSLRYCQIYWQALLNLLGSNSNPSVLMGEAFNEQDIIPILTKANDRTGLYHFYCNKLILCYLFGNLEEALIAAKTAKIYEDSLAGMFIIPTCYFYQSLILLENHTKLASQPDDYLQQIESNRVALKSWAQSSPCNHQHRFDLVEAEYYRVFEQPYQAMEYYDRAIAGAKANDYIHEEALGNELAAKLYLSWGKETVASGYMLQAYYCYAKWGAKTKTDDLEKRYPRLLQTILQQRKLNIYHDETIAGITRMGTLESTHTSSTGITSVSDLLDFTSVLKAAQAISGSIELDQLITNLTKIILENSGAKKSVLILPQKNTWFVKVVTFINYVNKPEGEIQSIILDELVDKSEYIPIKIINYVKNTLNTVVINNSQTEIPGLIGEYMLKHQPKSLLCKPIVNQGHLVAVLYLENQITSGVFTLNNLQVINLLSSQAAISLENARLYQQAQQALQDLQQAQLKIVQSEKMSALGNLVAGVAHEMNNPLGFIASTLKQAKPIFTDISEYLKLYQESFPNKSEEILVREEEIDLDYTLEDFPKMMDAMVIASDRLKNISTSLRTFSRADKDYKVSFNIHHGLDSTILILKHRLKANEQRPAIEVVKEYGNLPSIECFPGQLNQVFMNILANAIDALDESNTERNFDEIQTKPNQIIVKTLVENNQVKISIADNAKGMSEDIKQKIFDHLFTTKNVGKGTGLGLAIARQIVVEKHGGSIEVNSVPNQGTEFTICLTGI